MNIGSSINVFSQLLQCQPKDFFSLAQKAPQGAGGIILHPFFQGERVPNLPQSKATFSEMSTDNFNSNNLARATLEGVSFSLKYGLDLFQKSKLTVKQIRLIGGGSKNNFWSQLLSEIMGIPISRLSFQETASLGAALQSAWCYYYQTKKISLSEIVDPFVKIEKTFIPTKKNILLYQELYKKYKTYLEKNYISTN